MLLVYLSNQQLPRRFIMTKNYCVLQNINSWLYYHSLVYSPHTFVNRYNIFTKRTLDKISKNY